MEKGESLFGIVIAYVVPGFLGLWVVASANTLAASWLGIAAEKETTVGAFLFAALASLGLGLLINGASWRVLEEGLFKRIGCGVPPQPRLNHAKRPGQEEAYRDLREAHFRFFQFYGNTFIVLPVALLYVLMGALTDQVSWRMAVPSLMIGAGATYLCYTAARNCLCKYRERTLALLGELPHPEAA